MDKEIYKIEDKLRNKANKFHNLFLNASHNFNKEEQVLKHIDDLIADLEKYKELIKEENEEEKARKSIEHFKSLGIPESALCSPVNDDINCQRLEFGIDDFNYSGKPEWYVDYNTDLWISSSCQNLLDVLTDIEEETKQQIVKFGLKDTYHYATKENRGKIRFGKIEGEVDLSECNDSFNLKLSDGRYFHLYFCESK